jgi:predicted MFS family arabinose efflux permease
MVDRRRSGKEQRPMSTQGVGLHLRIFLPFACGYFLSYLYRTVNAVMAPNLATDLGLDPSALGLLTSAYFISFASAQLPLGVLLDRFGPRRIEAVLLLFAASGAFLFARGESLAELVIGRALIGFGVSACLMAAFKAFVEWFPRRQLPLINGIQMASGGLGALSATAPVEYALSLTDWRGVFIGLSLVTLIVALLVWLAVPDKPAAVRPASLKEQGRGVWQVFSSPIFWRAAPWATLSQATFLSLQSLWSGPWLRDVGGLDRGPVATVLFWTAGAMVIGYVFMGILAERLSRAGIRPMTVAGTGMMLFMLCQALMVMGWRLPPMLLWMVFGFTGTSGILVYADLSQRFPADLAGRVNTGLNLLVFVAAFAAQWGVGAVIDLWPNTLIGYAPEGYRAGFGLLLTLQVMAALWFAGMHWRMKVDHPL